MNRSARCLTAALVLCFLATLAPTAAAQPWWNTSWSSRLRLTFDNSAQAENLASFPVLVVLNSSRVNYTEFRPNGEDLRFIDADGTTVLPHEIETWDPAGISYIWVNVPQIDASSSADYVFLYYGNPSAPDGQSAAATWNAAYKAVWHLGETGDGTAGEYKDSTTFVNHGRGGSGTASQVPNRVTGRIGFGQDFTRADPDHIRIPDDVDLRPTSVTIEAWVKFPSYAAVQSVVARQFGTTFQDALNLLVTGNNPRHSYQGGFTLGSALTDGNWYYLAATVSTSAASVYVNGTPGPPGVMITPTYTTPEDWTIGAEENDNTSAVSEGSQGFIDEVRISGSVRSADWIAAQHLSMTDALISYGSPASQMLVQTGSFVGNGNDNRIIAGVGFGPDVVIIKGDQAVEGVIRTSTMTGDSSKPLVFVTGVGPDMIQAFNIDGFVVGTDARVNASGVTFHWTAFKAGPGQLTVGSYTGDGIDDRSIAGVGFQPDYVVTIPEIPRDAFHRFAGQVGDKSTAFQGGVPNVNRIQALEVDGFQIGDHTTVNSSGSQYHYVAWKNTAKKISVGSYPGDGLDNHSIPGLGLSPQFVIVQRDATSGQTASITKPASTGASTDTSVFLNASVNQADNIQALEADGFQVGTLQRVNNSGDTFYYAAFGNAEVNYRSIGNAPDYTAGSVSATNGSRLVYGTGTEWVTFNRGRGDRIRIDGVDYQVASVDGETLLALRKPFVGVSGSGKAHTLARQFTGAAALQDWEDCVSFAVACPFFPVTSGSLVSDNRTEIGIAYDDGSSFTSFTIDFSTTDETHSITLTADGDNRHYGLPGQGVQITGGAGVVVQDDYVVIEWMEIFGVSDGFRLASLSVGANQVVLQNNLIHDTSDRGIEVTTNDGVIDIINNIIHGNAAHGIDLAGTPGPLTRYRILNNTVVNNSTNGINKQNGVASPVVLLRNNISVGNSTFDYRADPSDSVDPASSNNLDGDGSGGAAHSPAGGAVTSPAAAVQFVNPGGGNFHINPGSTAQGVGADLSSLLSVDIDAGTRSTPWDIGADDIAATATPTTNYRSIGTGPIYNTGIVSATLGSASVMGIATNWVTSNRGRGDHIVVNGNEYTVLSVESPTQLTLTAPATASFTGPTYTISRQFTTLQAWETCISSGVGCTFFPVGGGDLVGDNRREVGIAYNDSVVPPNPDFTVAVTIDGSITDATHTITLTADDGNRHYGAAGQGVLLDNGLSPNDAVSVEDDFVTVEWLEIIGGAGPPGAHGIHVLNQNVPNKIIVRNNLIHNVGEDGIVANEPDLVMDAYNNIVYNTPDDGIQVNATLGAGAQIRFLNNTVYGCADRGLTTPGGDHSAVTLQSNIAHSNGNGDFAFALPVNAASRDNLASDGSGTTHSPFGGGQNNVTPAAVNFVNPAGGDLHILSPSAAENNAADLSGIFSFDVDGGSRQTPWDIGADDIPATTEVALLSFGATGLDGSVEILWETGSEIRNLGFHLYRSQSAKGPYDRVTARVIPGLGSSPEGARYRYRDEGLANGVTYFYELEDIETTGKTTRHGPVSAAPREGAESEVEPSASSGITYGEPETSSFVVTSRGRYELVVELRTEGFYAEPQDDGSVRVTIPGFEDEGAVPVKRTWLDVLAGRQVKVASVRVDEVEWVSLTPSEGDISEVVAASDGTVRARTRRARRAFRAQGLTPSAPARIVSEAYQGETKKALLELAPLRWNPQSGRLLLARRLVVRLSLRKPEAAARRRAKTSRARLRLVTRQQGLYGVRYEDLFRSGRGVRADKLRLSRQGKTVAFHVVPRRRRFRPGSTLYFVSDGANANPYGHEAVYELELGRSGAMMELSDGTPSGPSVAWHWANIIREDNLLYQAALLNASDPWFWDYLFAPETKRFSFTVSGLAPVAQSAKLSLRLQGASDFPVSPDHRVRVWVNGSLVGETSWDGKRAETLELELFHGVLVEGANELALENVDDTGASYSMVMLDGFDVTYPRTSVSETGVLDGTWEAAAKLEGFDTSSHVLDVTETTPQWLEGAADDDDGVLRFGTLPGRRYLAVRSDAVGHPEVRRVPRARLTGKKNRADYIVITPEAFLSEVQPLVALRREQGLRARAVSVESIFSEFGHGETNPEAIREFLRYAYHEWSKPSLRYVVLVGDATYDFKDFLQTGVKNQVPPLMVKTSFLWTASDPGYAAVNGDDLLPDIALGRLPAATMEEVRTMVAKILAYERSDASLHDAVVLVADNADAAGDFEADALALATSVLAATAPETIFLTELGAAQTERKILASFDAGASLVSYLGHGGIHLWATENIFNTTVAEALEPQPQPPLVLTMNCLNGYFHFPYFDALSEKLVKLEGRGAIAAFSPSGLSLNEPAQRLHRALLQELLHGNHERLGDAVLAAQTAYTASGTFPELLSIYHLLGDPALTVR